MRDRDGWPRHADCYSWWEHDMRHAHPDEHALTNDNIEIEWKDLAADTLLAGGRSLFSSMILRDYDAIGRRL